VVVGTFDPPDRRAISRARRTVGEALAAAFPDFDWRSPAVEREGAGASARVEPVDLLDLGAVEREVRGWDFALVVTPSDLVTHARPFAFGAPARSLAVAVASTVRIDPQAGDGFADEGEREAQMAHRLEKLAFHLFAHLNGVGHEAERPDPAADFHTLVGLDAMESYGPQTVEALTEELHDVADLRLEELESLDRPRGRLAFWTRVLAHNGDDILEAVTSTRFWQFPFRLSRLTTAAVSALLIFMITAEAWDLGMSQSPAFVAALSVTVLVAATGYVLRRQRLLVRRRRKGLSELAVVADVSIGLAVALGLLTTYLMLFVLTLGLAFLFFHRSLVETWAASLDGAVGLEHYLVFAAFVSSLGLAVGSLGASFEEQKYFRHVAYVDEET
jgi:hypothetical protein